MFPAVGAVLGSLYAVTVGSALKGTKVSDLYKNLKKFFVTIQEIFGSSIVDEAEYGVLME